MNSSQKKALEYAYNLLARRPYSKNELAGKLLKRSQKYQIPCNSEQINHIIQKLEEADIINDQDFSEIYISSQIRYKAQGRLMLKYKLKQKGVAEKTYNQAFENLEFNEESLLNSALTKKLNQLKYKGLTKIQLKQKLYRFLLSRGFESNSVIKQINNLRLK